MAPTEHHADEAFDDQEQFDEVVEIDEDGNIYKPGQAPRGLRRKPTILRDPKGEF